MFAKTEVNGVNTCDVFKFCRINSELHDKEKKQVREIPWNFAKFLIDSNGHVVSYHTPRDLPDDMVHKIEAILCDYDH